jgi:glycosyltransferase involved in cell wall biosynthesis
VARIGIFYHTDPVGSVPSGIDSFIRGILQWAPPDLDYTLFGASSDTAARPLGQESVLRIGDRVARFVPLIRIDATARRSRVPATVRYMHALGRAIRAGVLGHLDVMDFHRIEPTFLFRRSRQPKNVILHQDMSVIRDKDTDILWRHFPWLYERIEGKLFGGIDRIFSVRSSAVARYCAIYPDMATKFAFIPTWVDTTTFRPLPESADSADIRNGARATWGISPTASLLMFVGRLDRQKDPLLLLQAFALALKQWPDLHLLIVGDGVLRSVVEQAIADAGLGGRITLTGALGREAIAGLLRAADLFVLSSAYEGMPIAVLEALASGVPVASTDVGELRRVVSDGVNGWLARSREPEALADAILESVKRLPEMRGGPCEASVVPYHPQTVLATIYGNHHRQVAGVTA